MNMCGLYTETLFNAKFLDIPEFCVNTHTHTHTHTHTLSLSLLKTYNYFHIVQPICARGFVGFSCL